VELLKTTEPLPGLLVQQTKEFETVFDSADTHEVLIRSTESTGDAVWSDRPILCDVGQVFKKYFELKLATFGGQHPPFRRRKPSRAIPANPDPHHATAT